MPTMVHPESGQVRVVPSRSRSSYEQRGWKVAPPPGPAKVEQEVDRPAINDPKSDWVAFAEQAGVDTEGLTKAQVIDAVDV